MANIQNIPEKENLRVSNPKINQNFQNLNIEITGHINSQEAHNAQTITYTGNALGNDVKLAIDNTYKRISEIVAQAGDDNTEIVDARGNYPVLGDRLNETDIKISYRDKQASNFAALLKKVSVGDPIKIVCQGDSMTYGQDDTSPDSRPGGSDPTLDPSQNYSGFRQAGKTYPEALLEFSSKMYGEGLVTVLNRGYSGDWAEKSRERWNTNPNGDLHFVMLGTNDSSNASYVPPDVRQNLIKYIEDMSLLVEQILDFGSAVALLTPPKHSIDNVDIREAFRQALQVVGKKYHVPVIDTADFLKAYPFNEVQSDITHYNTKGYTTFAAKVGGILASIGSVYSPLTIRDKRPIIPAMNEYGITFKNNGDFTVAFLDHPIAPMGVGSVEQNGLMFQINPGCKMTFSFYAETDDLLLTPIFNLVETTSNINFEIDFDVAPGTYPSAYPFGTASRGGITAPEPINNLSYTGPLSRIDIAKEKAKQALDNSFHLPKRGLYSVSIENPGTSSLVYFFGFLVRQYETFMPLPTIQALKLFTTHNSPNDTNVVASSTVDPYEFFENFNIEGLSYVKDQFWKLPPLKLVVHNYNVSTLEYIIHFGVFDGNTNWSFGLVNQINYSGDTSLSRTLASIDFDGTLLTLNWAGATNRPTMFTLSLFS